MEEKILNEPMTITIEGRGRKLVHIVLNWPVDIGSLNLFERLLMKWKYLVKFNLPCGQRFKF